MTLSPITSVVQTSEVASDNYSLPRGAILIVLRPGWTIADMATLTVKYRDECWGWADVGDHLPPCIPRRG